MIELKTVRSMVYGLATADALGVPVEFTSRARLRQNPVEGMRSGGVWDQPAGTWSDDTSMALATMESIGRLKALDLDDIMNNFVEWFENDEFTAGNHTFDVGNTTATAIEHYLDGAAVNDCGLTSPHSNGNGSLMRIVPMAMYCYSIDGAELSDQSMDAIHEVSALTHAHARSQMACGIYCLIAAQLLDGKPIDRAVADGLIRAEKYYSQKFPDEMKTYARLFDPQFGSLDGAELSEQSMDAIHAVSALTHAHARSRMACGIYCLIGAQLLDGKPIAQAVADGLIRAEKYYSQKFPDEMKTYARLFAPKFGSLDEDQIESSGYVVDSLEAAIWCLLNTTNYRELALKAVNLGGDTDTVAAIAGGLGGIAYGIDDIPADWIDTLRNKVLLDEIAVTFFNAIEG
ncbi:MAG: ADP-ribosylglycohydrolase family protein [Selenomonadaceae bacterium]|nr:ADP-ribosylglycohydrolase family protein [Selenomonadaceae bacterium]